MKYDFDEVPKYKKKAKKNTPKKASHKHEWEPVILGYPKLKLSQERGFFSDEEKVYVRGGRCIICGRLDLNYPCTASDFIDGLNDRHPLPERFPNYPVIEVDDIFSLND